MFTGPCYELGTEKVNETLVMGRKGVSWKAFHVGLNAEHVVQGGAATEEVAYRVNIGRVRSTVPL